MKRRKRRLTLPILAAAAAALAAAFVAWPPLAVREGRGLTVRIPAGWRTRAVEAGAERMLQVEGGRFPPLRIEEHRGSALEPLGYAGGLRGRRSGLTAVRLGRVTGFETRTLESGTSEKFASARFLEGARGRVYFLFRDGGSFFVASWAEPQSPWQRWRAERVYRRVLSSLQIE